MQDFELFCILTDNIYIIAIEKEFAKIGLLVGSDTILLDDNN